jgi:uncharacterized C2H2 Zn-finger protein
VKGNIMPGKCPDCGKYFENSKALGPHRRQIHGFRKPKKLPKPKLEEPVAKTSDGMAWDEMCQRWVTPCPQCGQPRRAIKVNDEGTTLQCYLNCQCPFFMQPKDNARRVIVIPTAIETKEESEEPEAVNG